MRTHEISLHKNNSHDLHRVITHSLVLVMKSLHMWYGIRVSGILIDVVWLVCVLEPLFRTIASYFITHTIHQSIWCPGGGNRRRGMTERKFSPWRFWYRKNWCEKCHQWVNIFIYSYSDSHNCLVVLLWRLRVGKTAVSEYHGCY